MAKVEHISGSAGGLLVGNSHANGGIKAINKAIGKPLEMEGGEVVITKPAVDDNELHEFNGEMLTNRQILSKINESGGGVSFAELGAELPTEMHCSGTEYKYGGETLSDYEITHRISKCGCQHDDKLEEGGIIEKGKWHEFTTDTNIVAAYKFETTDFDFSNYRDVTANTKIKIITKVGKSHYYSTLNQASEYFDENIFPNLNKNKLEKGGEIIELSISSDNNLSKQLIEHTGDQWNAIDFENIEPNQGSISFTKPFYHKATGKKFVVVEKDMSEQPIYVPAWEMTQEEYIKKSNLSKTRAISTHKRLVQGQINDKAYVPLIERNKISLEKVKEIVKSAGIDFPEYLLKLDIQQKNEYSISAYSNPYEINRAIERFLDDTDDDYELTPDQKKFISHYSGYGGLEKFGSFSDNELKGLLYEYFTPDEIVKKMWALAYKYGFGVIQNPFIMEPSVGTGNFLKYAPSECMIFGNEINKYSKRICEILYPSAQIALQPFERNFIEKNLSIKGKVDKLQKYDLVIGNPPYGQANSKYMSMGEDNYTKARNFTEYFISRGLDLCKSGGLLIYVVGAEQYNGGTLFLDGGISEVKKLIAAKAQLVDAYRLPTKIFERTGVASEILVFKKN